MTAWDAVDMPVVERSEGKLERNETLTGLLTRIGAPSREANAALHTLNGKDLIDSRRLQPGKTSAEAWFEGGTLTAVSVRADADRSVLITRKGDNTWTALPLYAKLTPGHMRVEAEIESSIYSAALARGAEDQQVADFASAFAYDIDFQREIHPGDRFEILFETYYDERGNRVRNGDILYAALNGKAMQRGFYRFTPSDDGVADYYDQNGESATKFLMKHRSTVPASLRTSAIAATDLRLYACTRAPTLLPRPAPQSYRRQRLVQRASWNGGYGRFIKIKHSRGYETAMPTCRAMPGAEGRAEGEAGPGHRLYRLNRRLDRSAPALRGLCRRQPVNAMSLKLPTVLSWLKTRRCWRSSRRTRIWLTRCGQLKGPDRKPPPYLPRRQKGPRQHLIHLSFQAESSLRLAARGSGPILLFPCLKTCTSTHEVNMARRKLKYAENAAFVRRLDRAMRGWNGLALSCCWP